MKVLLLGSGGMLGQSIYNRLYDTEFDVISADLNDDKADYCFDFNDDVALANCITDCKPDIIINTAAIVDLSLCETNHELSYNTNARIPGVLAELCRNTNIYLIQISTDHFYTSDENRKHKEDEDIVLVNEYARTKYLGERLVLTYKNSLVLRTNIVGFRGVGKPTFVEWAINELEADSELRLFNDFYTSSIHTVDFANVLADILRVKPTGVFNLASSEVSSKKTFILALSQKLFNKQPRYIETSVLNINGPKRGESLGLDTSKIEELLGYKMPDLEETINSIAAEYQERMKK